MKKLLTTLLISFLTICSLKAQDKISVQQLKNTTWQNNEGTYTLKFISNEDVILIKNQRDMGTRKFQIENSKYDDVKG